MKSITLKTKKVKLKIKLFKKSLKIGVKDQSIKSKYEYYNWYSVILDEIIRDETCTKRNKKCKQ